jgi:hypothetical protein
MSQGSLFDTVQDQLFDAPAVSRAPSAPVGPSLEEQSAAAQEVHDLWALRLACTEPYTTYQCDDGPECGPLVFQGWFGRVKFARFKCPACGTSFPAESPRLAGKIIYPAKRRR